MSVSQKIEKIFAIFSVKNHELLATILLLLGVPANVSNVVGISTVPAVAGLPSAVVSVSAAANPTVSNILEDCANCTPTSYSFPSCLNRTYLKVSGRIM